MNTSHYILILIIIIALGFFAFKSDLINGPVPGSEESIAQDEALPEIEVFDINDVLGNMTGSWKSVDDEKSVKVFSSDSTTKDVYDGEEMRGGTWEIVNSIELNNGENIDGTFIIVSDNEEVFTYTVLNVDDTTLSLGSLPRGNTLNYERVAEGE
jgi:hypothetical protein